MEVEVAVAGEGGTTAEGEAPEVEAEDWTVADGVVVADSMTGEVAAAVEDGATTIAAAMGREEAADGTSTIRGVTAEVGAMIEEGVVAAMAGAMMAGESGKIIKGDAEVDTVTSGTNKTAAAAAGTITTAVSMAAAEIGAVREAHQGISDGNNTAKLRASTFAFRGAFCHFLVPSTFTAFNPPKVMSRIYVFLYSVK